VHKECLALVLTLIRLLLHDRQPFRDFLWVFRVCRDLGTGVLPGVRECPERPLILRESIHLYVLHRVEVTLSDATLDSRPEHRNDLLGRNRMLQFSIELGGWKECAYQRAERSSLKSARQLQFREILAHCTSIRIRNRRGYDGTLTRQ
jgi:hypothetical protein